LENAPDLVEDEREPVEGVEALLGSEPDLMGDVLEGVVGLDVGEVIVRDDVAFGPSPRSVSGVGYEIDVGSGNDVEVDGGVDRRSTAPENETVERSDVSTPNRPRIESKNFRSV
jgi:hypothetical protein